MSGKTLKILFALIILEVIFVRGALPAVRFFINLGFPKTFGGYSTFGFLAALTVLLAALAMRYALRRPFSEYGLTKGTKETWKLGIACLGLLFPIALLGRIADPSFDFEYARYAGLLTMSGVGAFLVTLPFFLFREELFLRFTQTELGSAVGKRLGILLLAANFAILHYPFGFSQHATSVLISVFFGAIVLNTLFSRTQNIWVALAVHVVYDALITLQIFFHATGQVFGEWVFWTAYAFLFALGLRSGISLLRFGAGPEARTRAAAPTILFFGALSLGLPILLLFVF